MRSSKKTVSLFQSHVFKHEFFLLESCPFPVPPEPQHTVDNNLEWESSPHRTNDYYTTIMQLRKLL